MVINLHTTQSPVSRSERTKINENWQRIIEGLSRLQYQVNILAGGEEVDELIQRINGAIDTVANALQDTKKAINDANKATTEAQEATTNANTAVQEVHETAAEATQMLEKLETLQAQLEQMKQQLETATTSAETATINANSAAQIATDIANALNEAIAEAIDAAQRANNAAQIIDGWGTATVWDATVEYVKNNVTTYNGSTWQSLSTNINSVPSESNTDWILLAQRGVDGTGSVSKVASKSPDAEGNVPLIPADIGAETPRGAQEKADGIKEWVQTHGLGTDKPGLLASPDSLLNKTESGFWNVKNTLGSTVLPNDAEDFHVYVGMKADETNVYQTFLAISQETAKTYTRVIEKDGQTKGHKDDSGWVEGGGSGSGVGGGLKFSAVPYDLTTTEENQKSWNLPEKSYVKNNDFIIVFHNGFYLSPTSWNILGDVLNGYVLNIPDNPITSIVDNNVRIIVFKNLPTDGTERFSGSLIEDGTVSLEKLGQDVQKAINKSGNADEVKQWVKEHGLGDMLKKVKFSELVNFNESGIYYIDYDFNNNIPDLPAEHNRGNVIVRFDVTLVADYIVKTMTVKGVTTNNPNHIYKTTWYFDKNNGSIVEKGEWTKVLDETDIVDNFITGGSDKVASAEAVKTLNDFMKSRGLGYQNAHINVDLNTLLETGEYYTYGENVLNYPIDAPSGTGYLRVFKGNDVCYQEWSYYKTGETVNSGTWTRQLIDNIWSTWARFGDQAFTRGTLIRKETDLNSFKTAGVYYCVDYTGSQLLLNAPTGVKPTTNCRITVIAGNGATVTQKIEYITGNISANKYSNEWERHFNDTWTEWIMVPKLNPTILKTTEKHDLNGIINELSQKSMTVQDASTSQKGIVQLSNSYTTSEQNQATTPYALSQVNNRLNDTNNIINARKLTIGGAVASNSGGTDAVVIGYGSSVSNDQSIAIGYSTKTTGGNDNLAIGTKHSIDGTKVSTFGYNNSITNGNKGMLIGYELAYSGMTREIQLGFGYNDGYRRVRTLSDSFYCSGDLSVSGTKNFEIPHPKPEKNSTHDIRHGAVESPTTGDTLYRYSVKINSETKKAKIMLFGENNEIELPVLEQDDGTFLISIPLPDYWIYLNINEQVFINADKHFGLGFGEVKRENEILELTLNSLKNYNVALFGTRNDENVQDWYMMGVEKEKGVNWSGLTELIEVSEYMEVSEVTEG